MAVDNITPNDFPIVPIKKKIATTFDELASSPLGSGVALGEKPIEPTTVQRALQAVVFAPTTTATTGDGKFYIHVDQRLDGMHLVDVHAEVITAGTTNTLDIQVANVTDSVDMLSTKLTVDSGETGSDTAAAPAVINTTNSFVSINDVLRIDVDAVHTTAPKGLLVTLGFA